MAAIRLSKLEVCPRCGFSRCCIRKGVLCEAYRYGNVWMASNQKHKCSTLYERNVEKAATELRDAFLKEHGVLP